MICHSTHSDDYLGLLFLREKKNYFTFIYKDPPHFSKGWNTKGTLTLIIDDHQTQNFHDGGMEWKIFDRPFFIGSTKFELCSHKRFCEKCKNLTKKFLYTFWRVPHKTLLKNRLICCLLES